MVSTLDRKSGTDSSYYEKLNDESQLRKIPAATWYRFQRLAEETGAVVLVFTPRRLLARAGVRLTLQPQFSLATLEAEASEVVSDLQIEVVDQQAESSRVSA